MSSRVGCGFDFCNTGHDRSKSASELVCSHENRHGRPPRPTGRFSPSLARVALLVCLSACGCSGKPSVVPVGGRVFYNDEPLPFGIVVFQPKQGQPGIGELQEDGSFKLSSYAMDDGAVPGRHAVSVSCYEGQRPGKGTPAAEKKPAGKLLIPLKYTDVATSGLSAEVSNADGQTFEFRLKGPPFK